MDGRTVSHAFGDSFAVVTSWIFNAPEAALFPSAQAQCQVDIQYAGPTWESVSGSKVVGSVIDRCTPDANAVPWLLLGAVSSDRPGIFRDVTYLQRLSTVGGVAACRPRELHGRGGESALHG